MLCEVVGVDTTEIDAQIENAEHERTEVNREVKQLEGQLAGMPEFDDVEPVSVTDLMAELGDAHQKNAELESLDREWDNDRKLLDEIDNEIDDHEREILELKKKIEQKHKLFRELEKKIKATGERMAETNPIDLEPIREKIATAEDINGKVALNKQRAEVASRLDDAKKRSADFTAEVTSKRDERVELMRSANWPVEGLGYDPELGVTFHGLPFSQCSSAEQLRISTAIGLSQNPELRLMIIRDGSLLDDESLAALHEMAVANDAQILVERVGTGVPGEIVIEDGTVANAK